MKRKRSNIGQPVAIYCRVSTQEQKKNGKSLEHQEAILRRYAEMRFPDRDVKVYSEVASARRTRRRSYKVMMREGKNGCVSAILATEISRLWRNLADSILEVQKLQEWSCDLVIWSQGIDTSTPIGKLQFHLISAMAQFESDTVSDRTKRAFSEIKRQGKKGPGRRPFGWRVGKKGLLERDLIEQGTVDFVLAERANGKTWRIITDDLNSTGRKTVGGQPWNVGGVRLVTYNAVNRRKHEVENMSFLTSGDPEKQDS